MQSLFNVCKNWTFTFNLCLPNYRSGYDAGFPVQESRVQSHWVAPRLIHLFILLWLIKLVPRTPGNLVVKSKLSPWSRSVALRQLNPIHKKTTEAYLETSWTFMMEFFSQNSKPLTIFAKTLHHRLLTGF